MASFVCVCWRACCLFVFATTVSNNTPSLQEQTTNKHIQTNKHKQTRVVLVFSDAARRAPPLVVALSCHGHGLVCVRVCFTGFAHAVCARSQMLVLSVCVCFAACQSSSIGVILLCAWSYLCSCCFPGCARAVCARLQLFCFLLLYLVSYVAHLLVCVLFCCVHGLICVRVVSPGVLVLFVNGCVCVLCLCLLCEHVCLCFVFVSALHVHVCLCL